MLAVKLVAEGLGLGFLLCLICAVGIRNGAVGMVHLYDPKVQKRVVQLGLTTAEEIRKRSLRLKSLCLPGYLIYVLVCVYAINGARLPVRLPAELCDPVHHESDRPLSDRRLLGRTYRSLDHPGYGGLEAIYHGEGQETEMDHGNGRHGGHCCCSLWGYGPDPEMRRV